MTEPMNLYKMPFEFGEKELIYKSQFEQGFLNIFPMHLTNNWLVFMDTNNPTGNPDGYWQLLALNITNGNQIEVTNRDKSNTSLLNFYVSAENGIVYWTQNVVNEENFLTLPTSIHTFDLGTQKDSVLFTENNLDHVDTIIQASNRYLVIERDPNDIDKPELIDIALLNLESQHFEQIPYSAPGSMPQLNYPYLVWKNNLRFDNPQKLTFYNIESHETYSLPFIGTPNSDVKLFNQYPYYQTIINLHGKNSLTFSITDVMNRKIYIYDPGDGDRGVGNAELGNGFVVWSLINNMMTNDQETLLCKMPFPFQ